MSRPLRGRPQNRSGNADDAAWIRARRRWIGRSEDDVTSEAAEPLILERLRRFSFTIALGARDPPPRYCGIADGEGEAVPVASG